MSSTAGFSPDTEPADVLPQPILGNSMSLSELRRTNRPDDVCALCWDGIFTKGFGLRSIGAQESTSPWLGGYEYSVSYDELLACKQANCMWYRCLERRAFGDMLGRLAGRKNARIHVVVGSPPPSNEPGEREAEELMVVVKEDPRREFRISMEADNHAAAWIKDWVGSVHVKISDTLALAKAYVTECIQEHTACQEFFNWAEPGASLPTRLINCFDPSRPHIVETKGWDPRMQYVALSYVWGGEQKNRTTKGNLSSYMSAINLSLLPKTIVDAIRVTHTLGIRYLWVDSLCIVQDSHEDKHRELRKMRDVYRRAFLTIDAANAESASQGFLHSSDRIVTHTSVWLPFSWSLHHEGNPRQLMDLLDSLPQVDITSHKRVSNAALAKVAGGHTGDRAWCLQESLMSGRRLRFTSDNIQLECRSFPQRDGNAILHKLAYGTITTPDIVFHPNPSLEPGSPDWFTIHAAWADVVQDYALRALSYPEDRLIACAGIAETFGRALGSQTEYLAGLWRDSLLIDLLWSVGDNVPGLRGAGHAPSWSWASQGHSVFSWLYVGYRCNDRYLQGAEELAEVVECAITLENATLPFGGVMGGHLILRAPLLGPYDAVFLRAQLGGDLKWDEVNRWENQEPGEECLLVPLLYISLGGLHKNWTVYCLVVHYQAERPDIRATNTVATGHYKRVGCCKFGVWQAAGRMIINPLIDSLQNTVDGRWEFPRGEIKLV
ncbi:HET-domain-containing protein [Cubamyces sp. BRFM 1775]|nr:HET-domain-containing protein [Cubamyces sp. BRFM 1775]